MLTYTESVALAEKFMIETGIRTYCSEICKGKCCSGCYQSNQACHKNEGRRLTCSLYVCASMMNLFESKAISIKNNTSNHLKGALRNVIRGIYKAGHKNNEFFTPHSKQVMDGFKISSKWFDFAKNKKTIQEIRIYIEALIKAARKFKKEYPDAYFHVGMVVEETAEYITIEIKNNNFKIKKEEILAKRISDKEQSHSITKRKSKTV